VARVDDLLVDARIDLPSATDHDILRALARSAGRFFRQSGVWRERIDPVRLRAGTDVYSLAAPTAGARVERIIEARMGSVRLHVVRERDMFAAGVQNGPPSSIALRSQSDECAVWPIPRQEDVTHPILIFATIVPDPKIRTIPDALLNEWSDGIVSGAKADLMSMPALPWTNPAAAANYERRYEEEVARAKREQVSGGHAPLAVQPVRFL
jgi:hypothetical protein